MPSAVSVTPSEVTTYSLPFALTDAELKAAPSGDIVIVPGETGKLVVVLGGCLVLDTSAGAYTNVDPNGVGLLYNGADASDYFRLSGAFDQEDVRAVSLVGSSFPSEVGLRSEGNWTAVSNLTGQPLVLSIGNGSSGNLTGGNPANSLKGFVLYMPVSIPS